MNDEPELVESPNRRKQPRRVRTSKTKEEQFVVDDTDESDKEEAQSKHHLKNCDFLTFINYNSVLSI